MLVSSTEVFSHLAAPLVELYKVCINHDPGMTLAYFMARSAEVAYPGSQVSVYRTIGPLVVYLCSKHRLCVHVRTASATVTAKLISAFVFAAWIVQFFLFLNPNVPVSSQLLCMYSSVCVGPGRKPR